ncbi:member of Set1p complex, histone methyl transferase [Yamadazyma tenuis]|nr:member of Set1p complex, histone methyl transferase [Yamadazyma tenuis]
MPRKTFDYHSGASITSLNFDDSGQYLISAGIDKSIQLYDVHKGIHTKDIQSQKYGAHLAKFTHKDLNCLYASTPEAVPQDEPIDHAIRYLSLSDKKYLRYFKGHKSQVVSLEVDPVHDMFITSSFDKSVKLWDLRTSNPTGSVEVGQPVLLAYDPHGIVFVTAKLPGYGGGDGVGELEFYDTKNVHQVPFLRSTIHTRPECTWTNIEFANNGKYLLLSTNTSEHYLIDAFSGRLLTRLVMQHPNYKLNSHYPVSHTSCFSSCGRYVIAGSSVSELSVFDLVGIQSSNGSATVKDSDNPSTLSPFKTISTNQGIPKLIAFNPKLFTVATADNSVTLWQPS